MKKIKITLLFSLVLSLSSCLMKEKDITKMIFPITMLLSKMNDKYQIYMLVLSSSLTSKIELESGVDSSLYTTIMFEGDSISEASEKMGVVTNGNMSAIKIKSIILHDSLFTNSQITYNNLTSYIINNPLYRTNVYVYYSNDDPDKILNANGLTSNNKNALIYLTNPDEKQINDFLLPSSLLTTAKAYLDNKRMFYLPSLKLDTSIVKQENEGELKEVNTYIIDGGYFLDRSGNFKYLELAKVKGLRWKSSSYFDLDLGSEDNLLNVKVEDLDWKTTIKNNQIHVNINVTSKINYNYTNLKISSIEEKIKDYIYTEVMDTYLNNYKEIDIYLFNDLSYRLNKKIDNIDNFNLTINSTIKNTIYEY